MIEDKIENIIFDLGGVLIDIDYVKTINAFKKLKILNFDQQFSQAIQSKLFEDFEKGFVSPEKLRAELKLLSDHSLSSTEIDHAWNSMIGNFSKDRISLLQELRKNYRIYLLSNTNVIHYNYFMDLFEREYLFDFNHLFDKSYWSFKINLRKPDQEVFEYVVNDSKLKRENTLFIDDSIQHVEGAKKYGIYAYHLLKNESIIQLFKNDRLRENII